MGYSGESNRFSRGKRVADLDGSMIVQTNDVAGDCRLNQCAIPRPKRHRIRNFNVLI